MQGQGTSWLGKPDLLLQDERTERFLELGGWKDKTEAHEAGVTGSSSNVYADNAVIAGQYQNDQSLRDSRFWYHAEVFDTDRLLTIASRSSSLNLKAIVNRLRNPVLLCYYLFYPAHRQSVSKDYCASITAREAACHAGDWQCIAVMLDTDGSNTLDTATPKFFGCTGSRPLPGLIDGQYQYRPYEFDAEQLTVMKVEEWRPSSGTTANLPEITGGHPRLYVARGSHSLYTTPGSHEVFPFPEDKTSQWCGNYDTSSVMPPELGEGDDDPLGEVGAFLAKMVIAGQLGPLAWVVGLALAAAEGVLPRSYGLNIVGTYDPPDPDEAPAAGDGTTVAPAGLTVPDGGADVEPWRARQGLEVNGRTYDVIVKRPVSSEEPHQIWWPSDDRETGFQGRWGQHVTSDFLPRRLALSSPTTSPCSCLRWQTAIPADCRTWTPKCVFSPGHPSSPSGRHWDISLAAALQLFPHPPGQVLPPPLQEGMPMAVGMFMEGVPHCQVGQRSATLLLLTGYFGGPGAAVDPAHHPHLHVGEQHKTAEEEKRD